MYTSSFCPLITKPTSITDKTATLIDNIFVDNTNFSVKEVTFYSQTYQITFLYCYITKRETEAKTSTEKRIRIINEKSMNKLIEEIRKENWKDILQLENPQDAYNKFIEKFKLFNDKKQTKETGEKRWITKGLKVSAKMNKDKLHKKYLKTPTVDNEEMYKKYRNKLNHTKRRAKKYISSIN